jgi:hypothetical protein
MQPIVDEMKKLFKEQFEPNFIAEGSREAFYR